MSGRIARCGGVRERMPEAEKNHEGKTRGLAAALALALAAAIAPVAHAGVAAGTLISNTAHVRYELGGVIHDVDTNAVATRVDEIVAFDISDAGNASTDSTNDTTLAFVVRSIGNGCENVVLAASASEGATLENIRIVIDANDDGVMQSAIDTVYTSGPGPRLCAGESVHVFVTIPDTAGGISQGEVTLIARGGPTPSARGAILPNAGDAGGDMISGGDAIAHRAFSVDASDALRVSLLKSQTVLSDPSALRVAVGDVVAYTLRFAAAGAGLVEDAVLSDPLPAGLAYVAGTLIVDGVPISDGDDADIGQVTNGAVLIRLPTAAAPFEHVVTFNARVRAPQ